MNFELLYQIGEGFHPLYKLPTKDKKEYIEVDYLEFLADGEVGYLIDTVKINKDWLVRAKRKLKNNKDYNKLKYKFYRIDE